jgi:hypothetical protein
VASRPPREHIVNERALVEMKARRRLDFFVDRLPTVR